MAARATVAAATTSPNRSRAAEPDRVAVAILAVAGFLAVLALLAWQLRAPASPRARTMILVRRVYETRVIETVVGAPQHGSSVTQSVSSAAPPYSLAPPAVTRAS